MSDWIELLQWAYERNLEIHGPVLSVFLVVWDVLRG